MVSKRLRTIASTTLAIGVLLTSASVVIAQSQARSTSSSLAGTAANYSGSAADSGQKVKIKGVVTRRDADTFTVKDSSGAEMAFRLTDRTSVQSKGGFLRSGTNYAQTNILRGLNLEVEGHRDASGELIADKATFNASDLRVARAVDSRAAP